MTFITAYFMHYVLFCFDGSHVEFHQMPVLCHVTMPILCHVMMHVPCQGDDARSVSRDDSHILFDLLMLNYPFIPAVDHFIMINYFYFLNNRNISPKHKIYRSPKFSLFLVCCSSSLEIAMYVLRVRFHSHWLPSSSSLCLLKPFLKVIGS